MNLQDMYKLNIHTSIKVLVTGIIKDVVVLATLLRISTMALMVGGDSTTSSVKVTVTLLSWFKNSGNELLVKACDI